MPKQTNSRAKKSELSFWVTIAMLSLIAGGGGWILGGLLSPGSSDAAPLRQELEKQQSNHISNSHENVVPLQPITTNLHSPSSGWIRLEASLAAAPDKQITPEMAATISNDFLNFLRATNLMQVSGASGLAYLRADLEERAHIRSEGTVERVFITSLVVE